MIREKKLIELYAFACKYARSFRNTFVEVDDLAHEMMLAVMKARWKDDAYATRVMRNRFYDLARRGKIERGYSAPFDSPEVQNKSVTEDVRWDARIEVDCLLKRVTHKQAKVLMSVMQGKVSGVSRWTEHRYVRKARELAISGGQ